MGTIGIGRGMSDLLGNLNCIIGHRFQETENADYHHGVLLGCSVKMFLCIRTYSCVLINSSSVFHVLNLCQIENLFYNMTARRKTLQNSADDYPKIVDLLSRFAIHHINVSFSCRKVSLFVLEAQFIYLGRYFCPPSQCFLH